MSESTAISWTDATFNPWEGCQKVGPGCDHCYAETRNARYAGGQAINWGPGAPRRRTSEANWRQPVRWNAKRFFECEGCGWRGEDDTESSRLRICLACGTRLVAARRRVFCASLADVFDNAVPPVWRADLFKLIADTPNLDWLLLTKRIGNAFAMFPFGWQDFGVPPNVWLGATIVNQEEADRDIPKLLATPARVRFLSMEPLLGPVNLLATGDTLCRCDGCLRMSQEHPGHAGLQRIDWVIVGGESGPNARPMHPDWARGLRDQCAAAGVPFHFKQWGEWLPAKPGRSITGHVLVLEGVAPFTSKPEWFGFDDGQQLARVGKKAAGRLLDGAEHNGFPA